MSENFGQREAQRGFDVLERAELAVLDQRPHALREGVVAVVERLHHHEPGAVGDRSHPFGFGGVAREGLLAQHVLPGLERGDRPLGVQPVGERVVDGVDVGIGEEGGVGVEHPGDPVLLWRRHRRVLRSRAATATISASCEVRAGLTIAAGVMRAGAEDADADGAHAAAL